MRGYYRVAVVALAMMIMFSVNYYLQSPDLVVYAATGDKMVQLRLNERVNLEKQRTPLGYGYVLEMSVEEGSRYYTCLLYTSWTVWRMNVICGWYISAAFCSGLL